MSGYQDYALEVVDDAAAMSRRAAAIVADQVVADPETVLAVPTGNTPLGMFADLIGRVEAGALDFGRCRLFCLDEYVGVAPDDPNSLTGWLSDAFARPARFDPARVHALPSTDSDPIAGAARYEDRLAALGGLDLAVLGLGGNGHVAYNEPGSAADSRTRVLTLTPASIRQAAAYWQGAVPIPDQAMTIGIGTLREAKHIVLIVSGLGKAEILRRSLEDPMTDVVPASWLRLAGPRLTVVADRAAASELSQPRA